MCYHHYGRMALMLKVRIFHVIKLHRCIHDLHDLESLYQEINMVEPA